MICNQSKHRTKKQSVLPPTVNISAVAAQLLNPHPSDVRLALATSMCILFKGLLSSSKSTWTSFAKPFQGQPWIHGRRWKPAYAIPMTATFVPYCRTKPEASTVEHKQTRNSAAKYCQYNVKHWNKCSFVQSVSWVPAPLDKQHNSRPCPQECSCRQLLVRFHCN